MFTFVIDGKVLATAVVVVAVLWTSACSPRASSGEADAGAPAVIAGGTFEASGVAHVPGTNDLLFVDDGRTREILLMELTPEGAQNGAAVPIPLGADVTDLEGITWDGRHFYVVGSQSKKSGFDGDGLVRFTFDPKARRADSVERVQGLKAWLAENVAELRRTERQIGDEVLNIEAVAWDHAGQRLLLGLRAPIVDGQALIVPVKLVDSTAAFTRENLMVDGPTIRVSLDGAGIRSLEYDEHAKVFRLISGAAADAESRDFRVLEWDGKAGSPLTEISTYPRRLKPEGITRAVLAGRLASVIVFDAGHFLVLD